MTCMIGVWDDLDRSSRHYVRCEPGDVDEIDDRSIIRTVEITPLVLQ